MSELEGEIDRMSKIEREREREREKWESESKRLVSEWLSDLVIKGSSNPVWSDLVIKGSSIKWSGNQGIKG